MSQVDLLLLVTAAEDGHQPMELKQDFSFYSREETKGRTAECGINRLGDGGYLRKTEVPQSRSSHAPHPTWCTREKA